MISIVVPCYNEEETIRIFYNEIMKHKNELGNDIEFFFVDDGSRDKTLKVLRELNSNDPNVHYCSLSRNFGKEGAMLCGFETCIRESSAEYIAVMDVDLQDPPEILVKMHDILTRQDEEYDCVASRRTTRSGEPKIRSWFAKRFYKLINKLSDTEIIDGARDFRLMKRKVVEAIIEDKEYNRFSKGIFSWVGFKVFWVEYENVPRSAGKTKWSFWKLFSYSIDGILAYSTAPLMVASIFGIIMFVVSLVALIFIFIRALVFGDPVSGWPSTICIMCLIGGCILLCLGIIGLYLSKIYLESKKRQIYIISESK